MLAVSFILIPELLVAAEGDVPDFSGAWALEGSATEPWPTEPPYTAAGRTAQESWAAHPEDDPARCAHRQTGVVMLADHFVHTAVLSVFRVAPQLDPKDLLAPHLRGGDEKMVTIGRPDYRVG